MQIHPDQSIMPPFLSYLYLIFPSLLANNPFMNQAMEDPAVKSKRDSCDLLRLIVPHWKDLNLLDNIPPIQKASSIFKIGFAPSEFPI